MKSIKLYFTKTIAVFALMFVLFTPAAALAQTGFDPEVDDTGEEEPNPAMPINNFVVAGAFVAVAIGYAVLNRKKVA
jgi:hypothetical protein